MSLTPDAKRLLAETIRGTAQSPAKGLRARLLRAIHDEADRRYRLSVRIEDAGLDEAHRRRRERISAWIDEQVRACQPKGKVWNKKERADVEARLLAQAEKQAAATLINRLVLLRLLEAAGLSRPPVVTGGWDSRGYREFREFAPTLCTNGTTDATEGYATLLQLLFDELAGDLPGLFGDVGLTRLFPVPAATLREVVERLDDPALTTAWTDDTTLGWVYQYWNDPDREALDAKISSGGKVAPHEIASKTQMFTERYMVEWLLQNSLGLTWLCICKKHGWTPDADQVLPRLEARRVDWRKQREAGHVAPDALMPVEGELEGHWMYYLPQPIPEDAVKAAPESVHALKLLDPAVGSGHFLVIAFGMLASLYREEARHRDEPISDREIAESILTNNLHGIDIDPRAIQIAAAGLYLKARSLAKDARPKALNLVAPVLQLGNLPPDDPAVAKLRDDLKQETGIPEALTDKLLAALAGVDYLGSLLKVDAAVDEAIREVELQLEKGSGQGDLLSGVFPAQQTKLSVGEAKATILDRLEAFLSQHSSSQDLGLRLDGQQLAAGVRFVRMAREGTYDVVAGNPPYHGVGKLEDSKYYIAHYPDGRPDLFAGFFLRAFELLRKGGRCSFITLSNWMFLSVFRDLRRVVRDKGTLSLADLGKAAFTTGGTLISTTCAVVGADEGGAMGIALRPHSPDEVIRDDRQPGRTAAALLAQRGRHEFNPRAFEVIEGEPIVYWWTKEFLARYAAAPKLGDVSPARATQGLYNNTRFTRWWHEVRSSRISESPNAECPWTPFANGSNGATWQDPLRLVALWANHGMEVKSYVSTKIGGDVFRFANEQFFFRDDGVAFSTIGSAFGARAVMNVGIFGNKGRCVFAKSPANCLCLLNSDFARTTMESLNPGVGFEAGDVNRVAEFAIQGAEEIVVTLRRTFQVHEAGREASRYFLRPQSSSWAYAQRWAQACVDRPGGAPLHAYDSEHDPSPPEALASFSFGVSLGRFGAEGQGVLDVAPTTALPNGILFVTSERGDTLDHPACAPLNAAWAEHGAAVGEGDDLRTYLRKSFFDYHKKVYENRPIYFPLSSAKKSFVAFVCIHRWQDDTLNVLLADHLIPVRRRLEGELEDLRAARAAAGAKGKAERRFAEVQKLLEELNDFIAKVTEIAEKGPPPPDDKTPAREKNHRYVMDMDDGVMVNSAALWPLLEPQWKDPKKWWRELATAQGKKDYDWSHLAARYFPERARSKCHEDPSLAIAHRCFWELHPAKSFAWELRLRDEIRPDFTIDEPGSDAARTRFLDEHEREAADICAAEDRRRARKAAKTDEESENGPLFDDTDDAPATEATDE